jgi:serine/threonine-protein kinase
VAIGKLASAPSPVAGTVRHCARCLAVYRTDFECCPHDGGELQVSVDDPLLGQVIADTYIIEALIGEGAMGRVYRARNRRLANQRFAIKILLGDLAAASNMRQRFEREARHAAKLDHPNVVNVLDFGRTDSGLHYLVMDLVEGCSLANLIDQGPLDASRVIRIAHQLCEGLEHAHGRGVIHRDFKSENILILSASTPGREIARIADFGLAMSKRHEVRLTQSGVACTPAYAAPEQLRGVEIDHRVDLYGLGVTIFEMLSGGYLPFDGDLDSSIAAKLSHEAPSILTLAPNVPPGLVTIVSRLLAYEPSQRPRSARAVIRALETSMTLKRPAIRTAEIRPLEREPTLWRRWLKGAVIGITITAMAIGARLIDDKDVPLPRVPASAAAIQPQR